MGRSRRWHGGRRLMEATASALRTRCGQGRRLLGGTPAPSLLRSRRLRRCRCRGRPTLGRRVHRTARASRGWPDEARASGVRVVRIWKFRVERVARLRAGRAHEQHRECQRTDPPRGRPPVPELHRTLQDASARPDDRLCARSEEPPLRPPCRRRAVPTPDGQTQRWSGRPPACHDGVEVKVDA